MAYILIIDDDAMILDLLCEIFASEGYQTAGAANGKEGLKMYQEHPADLIITDMIMPEMEGLETIMAIRKDNPEAKIIAISGGGRNSPDDYLVLAKNFGAKATFSKPAERQALLTAARELLA